jgi:hypothetical protein
MSREQTDKGVDHRTKGQHSTEVLAEHEMAWEKVMKSCRASAFYHLAHFDSMQVLDDRERSSNNPTNSKIQGRKGR